jgi:hypothetical protein
MPTRFNSNGRPRFEVPGIQSGYGALSSPVNLTIPPVGIEDADAALFHLFDKEIAFQVSTSDKNRGEMKRVPVIFTAGEKWALAKKNRALRDRNGALILPLITVVRTTIQQGPNDDIAGRGINQQTGEIIVKRRLDKSDRGYQGLINRLLLKHQTNLAVPPGQADADQLATERQIGVLTDDPTVQDGGLMLPDRRNNVYETLVLPTPQFYTAMYEVTFWAQYTVQMFQLIEMLISSFLPQGNAWRLDTPKGYWFVATVDGNVYNAENNIDDMSQEERMIKYKFNVKVPGYILATKVPGAPIPIKRYVSSPVITFDVGMGVGESTAGGDLDDPFLGADDPTLPLDDVKNKRRDQRYTDRTRLFPGANITSPHDPALKSLSRGQQPVKYKKVTGLDKNGRLVTKFVRVVSTNKFTGETIFAPDTDLGGLTIVVTED